MQENPEFTSYQFNGDLITALGSTNVAWDNNGRLTEGISSTFEYYPEGKLKKASYGTSSYMQLEYDPMGNRIIKTASDGGDPNSTRYIVDISGKLPTILCEIDRSDDSLKNRYFYANNSQPVCQLEEALVPSENDPNILVAVTNKYFYLHDRLGSVRQMIKDVASELEIEGESVTVFNPELVNTYTYNPYGEEFQSEVIENAYNPFRFTGQWYDEEISQYYL